MKRVVIFVLLILVLAASGCYRDIQEGAYTNISEGETSPDEGAVIEGSVTVVEGEMSSDLKDIVDTAIDAGIFGTLVTAVQSAELVDTLKGPGPFTVFAPTDEAFAALPEGTLDALLADKDALANVLTYHVVSGKVMAADVIGLSSARTVQGSDVTISIRDGNVYVDDAQVISTDIECSNGVIHVIDAVILPSEDAPMGDVKKELDTDVRLIKGDESKTTAKPAVTTPTQTAPTSDVSRYRQAFVEREGFPYVIEVDEGDLVKPVIQALDPDQEDIITFRYGPPLNAQGEWQTAKGMAGYYVVPITASDGELDTTTDILIIVNSVNSAPVIEAIADVTLAEGQTISFQPRVTDPDGDEFTVTYTGWMTSSTYQTSFDDAGVYNVNIIAADDFGQTVQTIQVTVTNVNRAPIMGLVQDVAVDAGELVQVNTVVADPDADTVTVSFTEPLDANGRWQTTESDVGSYVVKVTASDGELMTEQDITVTVNALNSAPVISPLAPITVREGETVVISPTAVDPDGDQIVFSYSGWMTSDTYTTTFTDAGSYVVTITVSDGMESATQNVVVTVLDVNRAPSFVFG